MEHIPIGNHFHSLKSQIAYENMKAEGLET